MKTPTFYSLLISGMIFFFNLNDINSQIYSKELPPPSDVSIWSSYGAGIAILDSIILVSAPFGGNSSPNTEHIYAFQYDECKWNTIKHWKSATFSSKSMGAKIGTNSQWVAFSEIRDGCKINLFKYENGDFVKKN